jgi:hypothetical protein
VGCFSDFEQIHELLESDGIFELKRSSADILEMLWRDEVANSIKDVFEFIFIDFTIDSV